MWKRQPTKLEVDRDEPAVKIVEKSRETSIKLFAHLFALQRARCSVDGEFGESRGNVERSISAKKTLRWGGLGKERASFSRDELYV
jgi:hypothetical protein